MLFQDANLLIVNGRVDGDVQGLYSCYTTTSCTRGPTIKYFVSDSFFGNKECALCTTCLSFLAPAARSGRQPQQLMINSFHGKVAVRSNNWHARDAMAGHLFVLIASCLQL